MPKIVIKTPERTPGIVTRDYMDGSELLPKLSEGDLGSTWCCHLWMAPALQGVK